jgi:hypothetical protein
MMNLLISILEQDRRLGSAALQRRVTLLFYLNWAGLPLLRGPEVRTAKRREKFTTEAPKHRGPGKKK